MFQFRIIVIVLILFPAIVLAQETRSKEVKKHYNVSADGKLAVDGKYGDVHVETWNKNEVDVIIKVEVTK